MRTLLLTCLVLVSVQGLAQVHQHDLSTVDGLVDEFLMHINREPGEKLDTAAMADLFLPQAYLTVNQHDAYFDVPVESISAKGFIELLQESYYEEGYTETQLERQVTQEYGIAHVRQTYEAQDSEGQSGLGVTYYQLAEMNGRWWVVSVLWAQAPE